MGLRIQILDKLIEEMRYFTYVDKFVNFLGVDKLIEEMRYFTYALLMGALHLAIINLSGNSGDS